MKAVFRSTSLILVLMIMPALVAFYSTPSLSADNKLPSAEVRIDNFTFGPDALTVPVNSTVTWLNKDDVPHVINSTDGVFRSKALDSDDKYSFTFSKPGTYEYFCSIHPKMTGKIIVRRDPNHNREPGPSHPPVRMEGAAWVFPLFGSDHKVLCGTSLRIVGHSVKVCFGQDRSNSGHPMHITRAADYAVRVMVHLAGLPAGSCVARRELTQATATPDSFLAKVLQQLVQAGMITSRRGSGGGFRLAVSAEAVSLLDVIEAIEGPTRLNVCLESGLSCDRKSWCAAHTTWLEAQAALEGVLRSSSIAELAARSCKVLSATSGPAVCAAEPVSGTPAE